MKNPMVEFKLKMKEWQSEMEKAAKSDAEFREKMLSRIDDLEARVKFLENKNLCF